MNTKKIAASVLASMLAISSLSISAFAEEEENGYEKKPVKAYIYSMDESREIECLFKKDNPDLPYVSVREYLDSIMTVSFASEDKGEGVFEITGNNGSLTVDTVKDTVVIKNYDFMVNKNRLESNSIGGSYIKESDNNVIPDSVVSLDFSGYGIDLLADDGQSYFPLNTLTDLFGVTYNSAVYIDGDIYFNHTSDIIMDAPYFPIYGIFENTERTQPMADYTYGELCFLMDKVYGAPSRGKLAASIREKGFDKTLDEYDDTTRAAKEHLKNPGWDEFFYGLMLISPYLDDGGHTALANMIINAMYEENMSDTPLASACKKLLDSQDAVAEPLHKWIAELEENNEKEGFALARGLSLTDTMKVVKDWSTEEEANMLLTDDDTAVFIFDSFSSEIVERFKWSVDHAAEKGLKNFIVDLSTNGGGDSSVVNYMLALMANKKSHTNEITEKELSTFTNTEMINTAIIDLNLDGSFDDKDKDVAYDLNFGILASRVSFSCGNYMPCAAQEYGIPVLGERSGGGGCMVALYFYPNGAFGGLSTSCSMIRSDGSEVDSGVVPDYVLTDGDAGLMNFYDLDVIKKDMDDFYGVSPEESVLESNSETESKPAEDKDTNPATGTAASLALAAAAVGTILIIRKKNRS